MKHKTFQFIDRSIECDGTDDGLLWWPSEWTDELNSHGFIDQAIEILVALPRCAVRVPWIIGSASKSLSGQPRSESESHLTGRAFDMSPMFSDEAILDPSARIMGLAWNVTSLLILSTAYQKHPCFVVEGDHLHVQPTARLSSERMYSAFTMPTWYPWTEIILDDESVNEISGSIWVFDTSDGSLSVSTPQTTSEMINALRV